MTVKTKTEKSTLYIVSTPIGNLGDFSKRAIDTLKNVDFIAAEDTRVSRKLLNHFEIKTPMISYFRHSDDNKLDIIIDRLLASQSCALISDAGTPAISDPGEELVRACIERDIVVKVVPGASAVTSALALSGQSTKKFLFLGFLPKKSSTRLKELGELKNLPYTLIFYEAPHELSKTLIDMLKVFGDRSITLVREMTKIYEEVIKTTLEEAVDFYKNSPPIGEFVLVLEGKIKLTEVLNLEEAIKLTAIRMEQDNLSLSEATKLVAKETTFSKSQIYKYFLEK